MKPLLKTVFQFRSSETRSSLSARLDGEAGAVAARVKSDMLDPGDTIEGHSKLILLEKSTARGTGDLWEWYCKLVAVTARRGVRRDDGRHPDAPQCKADMAAIIRAAIEDPAVSDIQQVK